MRILTIIALMLLGVSGMFAQDADKGKDKGKDVDVTPKYQIYLSDYPKDSPEGKALTDSVASEGKKRGFLSAILSMYAPGFVSKTSTATTSVMNLLIESLKGGKKKWLQAAQSQCKFTKNLAQQVKKDDFYCLPSTIGPLDPSNIKFKGFACRGYKECNDSLYQGQGKEEFRVYCKLRTDTTGISSIVNYSKFLVEIDTLMFNPFYCMLPYDTITKGQIMPFDFAKRKDLTFQLNVKVYSSWINEAMMVTLDQLLGEFNIQANIDEKNLNKDSIFVYSCRNDPDSLLKRGKVSIDGNCFLVPRSYTGTTNGTTATRAWGTGEYRVEMTVTETCQMDNKGYRKDDSEDDLGETNKDEKSDKLDWARKKWRPEWKDIKEKRNTANLMKNIGNTIVSSFKDTNGWVETFTEPFISTISESELDFLTDFLGVGSTSTSK